MLLDDKFVGFYAEGASLMFRPLDGEAIVVMRLPPDIDAHPVATSLNSACNGVLGIIKLFSNYHF